MSNALIANPSFAPLDAQAGASSVESAAPSRAALWAGRMLGGLPALFLLVDGGAKLARPAPVVTGTIELGYPAGVIVPLGVVLLVSTILYLVPRTAALGAILLTGYLGGAVATHVRVGNPWATHTLFPVYFGVMLWAGLVLRDPRLRALLPFGGASGGTRSTRSV